MERERGQERRSLERGHAQASLTHTGPGKHSLQGFLTSQCLTQKHQAKKTTRSAKSYFVSGVSLRTPLITSCQPTTHATMPMPRSTDDSGSSFSPPLLLFLSRLFSRPISTITVCFLLRRGTPYFLACSYSLTYWTSKS